MNKRYFDIACACFALTVFLPFLFTVAFLIYFDDRGSVFFLQERIGQHHKKIRMYKFRTMRDGDVTRVGRWLRATGIDEIPQFLNVLFGSMSVVGPRPLTENDINRLGWDQPRYSRRWNVLPGITGLAQLYGGHGAEKSWQFDRHYLRRYTFMLDVQIVFLSFVINIVGKQRVQAWLQKV